LGWRLSRSPAFQLGSSRPASIGSAHEPPCPSHNRARHLRSSARLLTPASHRMHLTHAAYASPSLGLALRLCLHGSARLILAVLGRVEGTAKGIAASVCRLRSCHPGRPAQHLLQPTATSLLDGRPAELLRSAAYQRGTTHHHILCKYNSDLNCFLRNVLYIDTCISLNGDIYWTHHVIA
jgi:hypothetical protein